MLRKYSYDQKKFSFRNVLSFFEKTKFVFNAADIESVWAASEHDRTQNCVGSFSGAEVEKVKEKCCISLLRGGVPRHGAHPS